MPGMQLGTPDSLVGPWFSAVFVTSSTQMSKNGFFRVYCKPLTSNRLYSVTFSVLLHAGLPRTSNSNSIQIQNPWRYLCVWQCEPVPMTQIKSEVKCIKQCILVRSQDFKVNQNRNKAPTQGKTVIIYKRKWHRVMPLGMHCDSHP